MNILYQCNDKYAPYCGVSVTSLFENNKDVEKIIVYILDDGISEENKKKFEHLADKYGRTINFIQTKVLEKKIKDLGIASYRGSYTANFKMFVTEYIPESVDRLVYIDSDTIVDSNIGELFTMNMDNKPLGMAIDSLVYKYKIKIGIGRNENYYNSGVLLFDMNEWRQKKCINKIISHVKNVRAHYAAPDQDLLNLTIGKDIYKLPPQYNMEPAYFMFKLKNFYKVFSNPSFYDICELEKAKDNVKIYHFFRVMGEFPWHKDNMHPFNHLFDKYVKISPWYDYEKQYPNNSIIFKIEKILYKVLPEVIFIRLFKLSHKYFMYKSNKLSLKNENNKLM